eukprot:1913232-Pleurochrysis_carterae.AAC.1
MTGLKTQIWRDPVAVGYDCAPQQTGDYSLALGCRACYGGSQSFDCCAIGSQCCALGQQERAVCVGFKACSALQKQEDRAIAIGYESETYGTSCVCIGSKTKSSFGKSIVLSASDEPFEAQSADAFYVNPKNVDHASLSDLDLAGAATLMYSGGRFEHFADFVSSSVTVVNNGIERVEEGIYRIPLVDAIAPASVSMHSTAIGSQINTSFVHEINAAGTQILIFASQDSAPSDSILFEFVLYVNAEIGVRAILGGPSVV